MAKTGSLDQRRARKAADLADFVRQYARKARRGGLDPNDRAFDRKMQQEVKRMPPVELDRLLREDEDEPADQE